MPSGVYVRTEETRKKMSNVAKERKMSLDTRKKLSISMIGNTRHTGYRHSEESRKKMSETLKGRKLSEEHKKKIGEGSKGRRHTDEAKKKIGNALRNRPSPLRGKKRGVFSDEWLENMSKSRKGKKHSDETRKKMSIAQKGRKISIEGRERISLSKRGEKSHFWKGGISKVNERIRKSFEYRLWRESVFKRDDYTCQACKKRGGILHADHIKPFAYFPNVRFDINNGRTLHSECHRETDTYGSKALKYAV